MDVYLISCQVNSPHNLYIHNHLKIYLPFLSFFVLGNTCELSFKQFWEYAESNSILIRLDPYFGGSEMFSQISKQIWAVLF